MQRDVCASRVYFMKYQQVRRSYSYSIELGLSFAISNSCYGNKGNSFDKTILSLNLLYLLNNFELCSEGLSALSQDRWRGRGRQVIFNWIADEVGQTYKGRLPPTDYCMQIVPNWLSVSVPPSREPVADTRQQLGGHPHWWSQRLRLRIPTITNAFRGGIIFVLMQLGRGLRRSIFFAWE